MNNYIRKAIAGVAVVFFIVVILGAVNAKAEEAPAGSTYIGNFKITHYCNCSKCCGKWAGGKTASGTTPTRYRTIAVDPDQIPYGTVVYIQGYGYRVAEDTGVGWDHIDVFCPDHELCLKYGLKYRDVYVTDLKPEDVFE